MRVAADSSRFGHAMIFLAFYLLGIGGFALGSLITYASDALIDRFVTLDKTPSPT
jgi:hypothetical protein